MNKPFQVTFTKPDRPDYEVTEIYQAKNSAEAKQSTLNEFPDAEILEVQQLHFFRGRPNA